jgi:GNAT superfamily N-acetyltransferase
VRTRRATIADGGYVTDLLALAFRDDPAWGWAFPDPERRVGHLRRWWALFVDSALARDSIWLTDDGGATSVWTAPGEHELSDEAEAQVEPLLRELVGSRTADVLELIDRFDASHPRDPPHQYLGLLGTHPDHRGQGKGMGLLAARLVELDERRMPVYLESTNPANNRRYERLGFEQVGAFSAPGGGPSVACMWRDAH